MCGKAVLHLPTLSVNFVCNADLLLSRTSYIDCKCSSGQPGGSRASCCLQGEALRLCLQGLTVGVFSLQLLLQADGAGAQLEQFLQDDLHRFMELREQLDDQASASDAAVLASTAEERCRRLSSSGSHVSNSGISFVRLPEDSMSDDDEADAEEHHPVAAALAAAAAITAVGGMATSPSSAAAALRLQAQMMFAVSGAAEADCAAAASEAAAAQQRPTSSRTAQTEAAASSQFVMEADEDIAAQKRAARARLAELEGCTTQQELGSAEEAAASSAKACPDWQSDGAQAAGSMHSSKVPERPRGRATMSPSKPVAGYRPLVDRLVSKLYEVSMINSDGVLIEHNQFLQHMVAGLLLCVVLLPVLWLLQADGGRGAGIVRSMLPAALIAKAEFLCNILYVCSAVGVLIYCLVRSMLLPTPLLHFQEPALERQYLLWSNSGRLFQDCLFQLTFLVVGSCLWLRLLQSGSGAAVDAAAAVASGRLVLSALTLVGSGLPVFMLVLLRSPRYVKWREPLLAGSRLCSVLALSVMQLAAGPDGQLQLNMPFIALAQVMSIACMQVRLSSFVPSQVLHLLVLLLCTRAVNPLLQFTQLFGGWLCLPCLVLYSMEMHSRKAFLATLAPASPVNASKVSTCSKAA